MGSPDPTLVPGNGKLFQNFLRIFSNFLRIFSNFNCLKVLFAFTFFLAAKNLLDVSAGNFVCFNFGRTFCFDSLPIKIYAKRSFVFSHARRIKSIFPRLNTLFLFIANYICICYYLSASFAFVLRG